MLFVRVISQDGCDRCARYTSMLGKYDMRYELYDGAHPDHQKQLDDWNVFDFPVVQIVSRDETTKAEKVEYQFPFVETGGISVRAIKYQMNIVAQKVSHDSKQ